MAPLAVVAVTPASAHSTSKPPLALLRSRSAEACPIQACPREPEIRTVPSTSPIRTAIAAPSISAGPAMWPTATSPAEMFACSASTRSLDPARRRVQLALAERPLDPDARVRQVRDEAGAGGQVDGDGDRTVGVAGGGR